MIPRRFELAPDLAGIVRPGVLELHDLEVREADARLATDLRAWIGAGLTASRDDATLEAVRRMYKRFGIDPTKTRPSSEALRRRLARGDPFPRINTLVDVCNWRSVEFCVPYGLYDLDHVEGDVTLRRGSEGEEYQGIRKDMVHLTGRPTLADALGPFGNPTSDSARTQTTLSTQRALVVVFAPAELTRVRLERVLDETASFLTAYAGGAVTRRRIVG